MTSRCGVTCLCKMSADARACCISSLTYCNCEIAQTVWQNEFLDLFVRPRKLHKVLHLIQYLLATSYFFLSRCTYELSIAVTALFAGVRRSQRQINGGYCQKGSHVCLFPTTQKITHSTAFTVRVRLGFSGRGRPAVSHTVAACGGHSRPRAVCRRSPPSRLQSIRLTHSRL